MSRKHSAADRPKNRKAYCSFCRKSYRYVGPLVEGPGDVYICGECIELCQSIIEQEKRRRDPSKNRLLEVDEIVQQLDRVVGGLRQDKQRLAAAVRGHYERLATVHEGYANRSRVTLPKGLYAVGTVTPAGDPISVVVENAPVPTAMSLPPT